MSVRHKVRGRQYRRPLSTRGALVFACFACLAGFVIAHFLLIRPLQDATWLVDYRMRHPYAEKAFTWLLYALTPPVVALPVLFRTDLLRDRRVPARIGLLFLIACGLCLGIVVVSWLVRLGVIAYSMAPKRDLEFR